MLQLTITTIPQPSKPAITVSANVPSRTVILFPPAPYISLSNTKIHPNHPIVSSQNSTNYPPFLLLLVPPQTTLTFKNITGTGIPQWYTIHYSVNNPERKSLPLSPPPTSLLLPAIPIHLTSLTTKIPLVVTSRPSSTPHKQQSHIPKHLDPQLSSRLCKCCSGTTYTEGGKRERDYCAWSWKGG